jgi:hypothetical protein
MLFNSVGDFRVPGARPFAVEAPAHLVVSDLVSLAPGGLFRELEHGAERGDASSQDGAVFLYTATVTLRPRAAGRGRSGTLAAARD